MREICRTVCPFFAQQTRANGHASTRKIIAPVTPEGKREIPLSSLAYFDASLKNHKSSLIHNQQYAGDSQPSRATAAQNRRIRHDKPVEIAVHADMLKVRLPANKRAAVDRRSTGGGIRGTVNGFSRASRKRMIEFMASVRNTGSMLFLTMTFDDSVLMDLDDNLHPMFEAFRRRFERAYPTWKALYRKEWQDRKSGDFIGTFVPHYHFIIMTGVHYEKSELQTIADSFADWGKAAWHEITGSSDENHLIYGFDVSPIKSRKHAYYYVSKYVAKENSNGDFQGRHWGRIGQFDTSASEKFLLSEGEYIVFRRLVKRWLKTRINPLPDRATETQKKAHTERQKKQKKWSRRFAKGKASLGCTIFGLGDTCLDGSPSGLYGGYWQFIAESQRQIDERRSIERSYGD